MDEIREVLRQIRMEAVVGKDRVPASNKGSDNLWRIHQLANEALAEVERTTR